MCVTQPCIFRNPYEVSLSITLAPMLIKSSPPASGTLAGSSDLPSCRVRYACLFSAISPIVGYGYTGRFKQLGYFFVGGLAAFLCAYELSEPFKADAGKSRVVFGLSLAGVAAADNSLAILLARKRESTAEES